MSKAKSKFERIRQAALAMGALAATFVGTAGVALADPPHVVVRPNGPHDGPGGPRRPGSPVVVVRPGDSRPGPGGPQRPGRPGARPPRRFPPPRRPFLPPRNAGRLPPRPLRPGYRPPVVVVNPRIPGRIYVPAPSRDDDDDEVEVTRVMMGVIRQRSCERLGDVLREMANVLMDSSSFVNNPRHAGPRVTIIRNGETVEITRRRWSEHLNSARFWQVVWDRLALMYSQCDRPCFDDGVAVGQISATGYCSASLALGGMDAPGFEDQKPLPMCQNSTFTGCLVGYDQGAASFEGCSLYTTGGYTDIYNESKSQDCHMDDAADVVM